MLALALLLASGLNPALADESNYGTVRVGVLKFGTVNWELDVMAAHALAQKYHFNLRVVPLASADASTVALQGDSVDIIVSDWIWVTRQRAEQLPYTFVPFSNAVGSVMVRADGPIHNVADLAGKSIGISGGPTDKTWLLLRAYALKQLGSDLATSARPVYAAPPLLNELALGAQVDAALNVWHYDARLQASGMRALLRLPDILAGLGIYKPMPLVGWVFRDDWAARNTALVQAFLAASAEAKKIMSGSDAEWERLRPLMHAEDKATFLALRSGYRDGIPDCTDADFAATAASAFHTLASVGGERLTGKATMLADGTFWAGYHMPACPSR